MQKITSLLCLSLLLSPCFVKAQDHRTYEEVVKQGSNKKNRKPKNNQNQSIVISHNQNNEQIDQNSAIQRIQSLDISTPKTVEQINTIEDHSISTISIESSSPVEQKKRGFFGKIFNTTKSYRDLAVDWLTSNSIDKQWRDQAQNDIKWAMLEENSAVKKNRNGNEDFIKIHQDIEKKPSKRHEIILQMFEFLKKNEENVHYIDMFVRADSKGLPFDTAGLLEDTYKTLEAEKKYDLLLLALITSEIQDRVQAKQKTCNYIYNMTKDNKNVVGLESKDDYNDPSVVFKQSQQLMNIIKEKSSKTVDNK